MRRIDRRLWLFAALPLLAAALWLSYAAAMRERAPQEHPVVALARDLSGGDAAVMAKVRAFAAAPPSAIEEIGFHGAEGYGPDARIYLAAVNLLDTAGFIRSAEDKYTNEFLALLDQDGAIDAETLPPAAKAVFGPIIDQSLTEENSSRAYRESAWTLYAEAAAGLEAHIAARGKVLLSIDATAGDTMFFALADKAVADRWRNTAFSEEAGYRAGVRPPMWDRFWIHLAYALGPALADESRAMAIPPGTPLRDPGIPMAGR
jgi:hypothetical protein